MVYRLNKKNQQNIKNIKKKTYIQHHSIKSKNMKYSVQLVIYSSAMIMNIIRYNVNKRSYSNII